MAWSSLNQLWKLIKYRIENPDLGYKEIGDKFGISTTHTSRLIRNNYQDVWNAKKKEGVVSGRPPELESLGPVTGYKPDLTDAELDKILDSGMEDPNRELSQEEYDLIKSMDRNKKAKRLYRWHEKGKYKPRNVKGLTPDQIREEFGGANKDIYEQYVAGDIDLARLRQLSNGRRAWRIKVLEEGREFVPRHETDVPLKDKIEYIKERVPDYPFEDRTETQIYNKYHVLRSKRLTQYGKYENKDWDEILKSPEEIEKAAIKLGRSSFRTALSRAGPQAYPLLGNKDAQRHLLNEFIDAKRVFLNKLAKGESVDPYDMGHLTSQKSQGLFYGPNIMREGQFENRSRGSENLLSAADVGVDLERADTFLDILHKNRIGDIAGDDVDSPTNPNIFSQLQKPDVQYIDITPEQTASYDQIIRNALPAENALALPEHLDPRYTQGVMKPVEEGGPDKRRKTYRDLRTRLAGHSPSSASVRGFFGTKLR